jgi:putative transposase
LTTPRRPKYESDLALPSFCPVEEIVAAGRRRILRSRHAPRDVCNRALDLAPLSRSEEDFILDSIVVVTLRVTSATEPWTSVSVRQAEHDDHSLVKPMQPKLSLQFFEPTAELAIVGRRLPHWSQAGTVTFITWRTADSMPAPILDRWHRERVQWLHAHGIDPQSPVWRDRLHGLGKATAREFFNTFANGWHDSLDTGYGACVLRSPELAEIVARSLHHFDGERYLLLDFVIMPNHVHLLATFPDERAMLEQCKSWKHFTATQLNRRLHASGRFWQSDAFDHLLRSEEQFEYLRRYIADNPTKAGLKPGEFVHFRRDR